MRNFAPERIVIVSVSRSCCDSVVARGAVTEAAAPTVNFVCVTGRPTVQTSSWGPSQPSSPLPAARGACPSDRRCRAPETHHC